MTIPPISQIPLIPSAAPTTPGSTGGVFAEAFAQAVDKVESFQTNEKESVDKLLAGEGIELHKVALDSQQAQLSFDLFMQVRNKVVAAYQEVMRMQV